MRLDVDGVEMFKQAASRAARLARSVTTGQMGLPTPCADWDVAALLEHIAGGPAYLLGALGVDGGGTDWPDARLIERCVTELRAPSASERRCMSPAGFEWSVGEAAAGTAMDQLIHSWDLAVAIGADRSLDPDLAAAVVEIFLPHMPEIGRRAGLVGPAVPVPEGASPQDVLLGAMGRDPRR